MRRGKRVPSWGKVYEYGRREEEKEKYNIVMARVNESMNIREYPDSSSEKVGLLYADCGGTILSANNWRDVCFGGVVAYKESDPIENCSNSGTMIVAVNVKSSTTDATVGGLTDASKRFSIGGVVGVGVKPAVGSGAGRVDETPFHKGVFAVKDTDSAVIIHDFPFVGPSSQLFHVADIFKKPEVADIAVADNDIAALFNENTVTAAVGVNGKTVKNHIAGVDTLNHASGKLLFAFEDKSGSTFVKGVTVRSSGNNLFQSAFEIFLIKNNGAPHLESGIAGAEHLADFRTLFSGNKGFEFVIGILLQEHDRTAPRLFVFHINGVKDGSPLFSTDFPVPHFGGVRFVPLALGAVDVVGAVFKRGNQSQSAGTDMHLCVIAIGVDIGHV